MAPHAKTYRCHGRHLSNGGVSGARIRSANFGEGSQGIADLTMRLSDARLRQRRTKLFYLNHRLPPWLTEDATPRSLEPIVRPARAAEQSISFVIDRIV
jgi:hypothetical protein